MNPFHYFFELYNSYCIIQWIHQKFQYYVTQVFTFRMSKSNIQCLIFLLSFAPMLISLACHIYVTNSCYYSITERVFVQVVDMRSPFFNDLEYDFVFFNCGQFLLDLFLTRRQNEFLPEVMAHNFGDEVIFLEILSRIRFLRN